MKFSFIFFFLFPVLVFANKLRIDPKVLIGNSVEFQKYEGPRQFDNYLAMNLPFKPVLELHDQLELKLGKKLKSRGEAHITVITPVEYWNVLRPKGLSIGEINRLAEDFKIQEARFLIDCLGEGQAMISNKQESTYFIVVKSPDLIALRKLIQAQFVRKGGLAAHFDPDKFYPHITIGFTKVDLYESDGVIKDQTSCIADIHHSPPLGPM